MTEATENTVAAELQQITSPEIAADVQRVIEKVGKQLDGEVSHVALSALICLISGAITGTFFEPEQRKAASLFLLSSAVQVSIQVGVTDKEITSAMVQNDFYGTTTEQ